MKAGVFFGYASNALVYDPRRDSYMLAPDYDLATGRLRFEIIETLDNTGKPDVASTEPQQNATVIAGDGTQVASGVIRIVAFAVLQAPAGVYVILDCVEIDGIKMGYVPSEPLEPGVSYEEVGGKDIDSLFGAAGSEGQPQPKATPELARGACFGPETMIQTQDGEIPVEWLETSDMVLTRDNGFQPIIWICRSRLLPSYFLRNPDTRPVCLPAGSLGSGCPTHDLQVTGTSGVLLSGTGAETLYDADEKLAPAHAWLDVGRAHQIAPKMTYTVTHIMCARHEIIVAQGAWVETMCPDPEALARLPSKDLARIVTVLGENTLAQQTARARMSRKEALAMIAQIDAQEDRDSIAPHTRRA